MRSLEERQAQRNEQKKAEAVERKGMSDTGNKVPNPQEPQFDAKDWLNDSAGNVTGSLSELDEKELAAVEAEEKRGKNRAQVNSAIAKEKESRTQAAAKWTGNNG